VLVVPKSFSFAQSRRSGSLPCVRGGVTALSRDGGVVLVVTIPQSPLCGDSPLYTRGPWCASNRICGGRARHASERKFDEPIGSAGKRP